MNEAVIMSNDGNDEINNSLEKLVAEIHAMKNAEYRLIENKLNEVQNRVLTRIKTIESNLAIFESKSKQLFENVAKTMETIPWECKICLETFDNQKERDDHQKQSHIDDHQEQPQTKNDHQEQPQIKNDHQKQKNDKRKIVNPQPQSTEPLMNECVFCEKQFISKDNLLRHIRKNKCSTLKCQSCEKYFNTLKEMDLHNAIHHKIFKCSKCMEKFRNKSLLEKHIKTKHDVKVLVIDSTSSGAESPEEFIASSSD
ncbi:uncharacterized protein LOC124493467 [Dermatophagoides farinae]|uniref:uncharacterized protein LOC124493467 n=1 Tax=Dermatophagoides farinae TaxID=6954 RepID=UPI003F5DB70E